MAHFSSHHADGFFSSPCNQLEEGDGANVLRVLPRDPKAVKTALLCIDSLPQCFSSFSSFLSLDFLPLNLANALAWSG